MEELDARDRECNLSVTGVPDGQESLAGMTNDMDKCKHVLEIVEASDIKIDASRLGAFDQDRARTILVRTSYRAERDRVLEKTKKLKDAGEPFKDIYIKKDVHPSVRREWSRLREAEKAECEKPNNQGCDIRFDTKRRRSSCIMESL